jgi:hypothetical protein
MVTDATSFVKNDISPIHCLPSRSDTKLSESPCTCGGTSVLYTDPPAHVFMDPSGTPMLFIEQTAC